jgi:hypothetical protein
VLWSQNKAMSATSRHPFGPLGLLSTERQITMIAREGELVSDGERVAALYEEFAADDRLLAEAGMCDFNQSLVTEDCELSDSLGPVASVPNSL